MTKLSRKEIVIHKLKGQHRWESKGLVYVCKVCGQQKDNPTELNTFISGTTIDPAKVNENFDAIAQVLSDFAKQLNDIAKKIDRL